MSWALIFHKHLLFTGEMSYPFLELFEESLVKYIKIETMRGKKAEEAGGSSDETKRLLGFSVELLNYVRTHRIDINNACIGLRPSKETLQAVMAFNETERGGIMRSGTRHTSKAGSLVVVQDLKEGNNKKTVFARVAAEPEAGKVPLYVRPDELTCKTIPMQQLKRIPKSLLRRFHNIRSGPYYIAFSLLTVFLSQFIGRYDRISDCGLSP